MQFLKTLFWVVVAVALVLFASRNWVPVTINLWGGLQADVKLPVLITGAFLLGFLPIFLLYRARMWSLKRRLESHERTAVANSAAPTDPAPPRTAPADPDRIATDNKVWPAS